MKHVYHFSGPGIAEEWSKDSLSKYKSIFLIYLIRILNNCQGSICEEINHYPISSQVFLHFSAGCPE